MMGCPQSVNNIKHLLHVCVSQNIANNIEKPLSGRPCDRYRYQFIAQTEIYISALSNLYSLCMPAPTLSRVTLTQLVHKIFSGGCYNNARPDLSSNML